MKQMALILIINRNHIIIIMQKSLKVPQKQKPNFKIQKIDVNIDVSKNTFQAAGVNIFSPVPLYEGQKMFVSYIIQCLKNNQNALVQSPTGTGKTLSLLCSTLSWVKYEQQIGRQPTRIIYTTRTHSQIKQIVQQIVKTGFHLKMAILGSRDQTCINDDLKQLSGQGKQLQCRLRIMRKNDLFCKYFHHQDYYGKVNGMGQISDLQQIKYLGKTQGYCPYFYQKYCKNVANIILMPYSYLFEQKTSNNQQITNLIQNSIVIFDEGHNIPNCSQNSKQFTISLLTISRAIQHLNQLRQQKLKQQKGITTQKKGQPKVEQQQYKYMKSTSSQLQMHASYASLIQDHVQTLQIPLQQPGLVLNMNQFLNCLDNGTALSQFGKLKSKFNQLNQSFVNIGNDILLKPYWALQNWISFLIKIQQMHQMSQVQSNLNCFICQIVYNGSDIKINLYCLDPKVGFQKINKMKPKSIILTSGTLSPLNSISLQLQIQFNKPLACPHIMTKQQVNGCVLTKGPKKVSLNFKYQNRNNSELYVQLGAVLLQIVSKTPNGVIVFVPSYKFLQTIKLQLTNNGFMSKIYGKKNIFYQKSNSADFKQILQKYLQQACKSKGALLFALARGKISQGLDFSDQKCRAVVLVGVPYPASNDLKVKCKMEYLDNKSKTTKTMNGNQWYICETIRCINQSIGRIIRNKNDYGSIYLIDQRFKKNEIFSQISSWARQCIKVIDDYEQFKFKIQILQQYFKKKNQQLNQMQHFFTSHLGTKLSNKITINSKPQGSISISRVSQQTKDNLNNYIRPQRQLEAIKNQLKIENKIAEQKQKQMQPEKKTKQKIIFGNYKSKKNIPTNQLKQCPICRLQRILIKNTQCIHQICEQCWDIWLKKDLRCPICRVRVRQKYLIKY